MQSEVDERGIRQNAAGRRVADDATVSDTVFWVYFPLLGGSCDKHYSCGRACPPQRSPEPAYRRRPAGHLGLEKGLCVVNRIRRRSHHFELVETDLQFLGDQCCLGGVNSLAHLGAGHHQEDASITPNANKAIRCEARNFDSRTGSGGTV